VAKFGYKKPWAWDLNPIVFIVYGTSKAVPNGYVEGFNIRYMNKKYWAELEDFVDRYPDSDGRLIYYLIKRTKPVLLKAYRRYLYERMSRPLVYYPLSKNRGRIRTKALEEGGIIG
jgi:hypothetical protein